MTSVLLVEDEQITAMEIRAMLEDLGYEVTASVDTGEACMEQVESNPPDVILMDIRIPGEMDGVDATREIKADHQIPVIYLTAHSDNETLERAKETQPSGYLVKPITENDLRSAIEMAIE